MRQTSLNMVYELAKRDPRVIFIGSDRDRTRLKQLKAERPGRIPDGRRERGEHRHDGRRAGAGGEDPLHQHHRDVSHAALFEQIVLDLGLHKTKVRLIGSGGGMVYAPLGPTHWPPTTSPFFAPCRNMTILAPADADEMRRLMLQTLDEDGPVYIRLAKGGDPVVSRADLPCDIGKAIPMREGRDALIVATGICLQVALEAAAELEKHGVGAGVLHVHTLKPLIRDAG